MPQRIAPMLLPLEDKALTVPTTGSVVKSVTGRKARPPIENLSGLLERLCSLVDCDKVPGETSSTIAVRQIIDTIGRRAYGPVLLALGLFSISPLTAIPGMTWASAAFTLLIALQLTVGMERPWMPRNLLEARVSSSGLVKAVDALRPAARVVDRLLRPRLNFLARLPFVIVIGLLCCAAALVTFPLGFVPFLPIVPGLAVVLFGLGLVARDGLLLLLGAAGVIGAFYLAHDAIESLIPMLQNLIARLPL